MDQRTTGRATTADVRAGIYAAARVAGPEYVMLAVFVAVATNLLDFAVLPAPGDGATGAFVAAAIVRIVAVFYATYAIERRMAGVPAPLAPRAAFLPFFVVTMVGAVLFGLVTGSARLAGGAELDLATRWLVMLALAAVFGVVTVRLSGWAPALAVGEPFGALPGQFRRLRGAGVPLALAFLQLVLPFVAIHLALTLIGVQLPLSGPAFAALALIDGVVSAIQLILASALSVVAWRLGADPGALRAVAARR